MAKAIKNRDKVSEIILAGVIGLFVIAAIALMFGAIIAESYSTAAAAGIGSLFILYMVGALGGEFRFMRKTSTPVA